MKIINVYSIFIILSASNSFAGSVHNLKTSSIRYADTLANLHGAVESGFVNQAEQICGKGNVRRLFNIRTETFADFEIVGGGYSLVSSNYPKIFASAKVECN